MRTSASLAPPGIDTGPAMNCAPLTLADPPLIWMTAAWVTGTIELAAVAVKNTASPNTGVRRVARNNELNISDSVSLRDPLGGTLVQTGPAACARKKVRKNQLRACNAHHGWSARRPIRL